jgi:hypothetical protein
MTIDLISMDYFTFSWFDTSLDIIEKYIGMNDFKEWNINFTKNCAKSIKVNFEYNPNIITAYFLSGNDGIIMLPNLQDGWLALFYRMANDLKINGYHFKLCSDKEPYNCLIYLENGVEKRICYTLKDTQWIFFEKGEPLFFEETENYTRKIKKDRLNKEIMIKYCNKLGIINGNILEINQEKSIKLYKNNRE